MTQKGIILLPAIILFVLCAAHAQQPHPHAYPGFDRNDYPGDAALPALRKSFTYTSYSLNPPPGETTNSWSGKRAILQQYGFGFLLLFNGRTYAELKAVQSRGKSPAVLGAADAQAAYLFAWIGAVRAAGSRPGVYCSGIQAGSISTAEDIASRLNAQKSSPKDKSAERPPLALWVANDQCPPSPGCSLAPPPLSASFTPATAALTKVWQYAQSPRRQQFSAACPANQAPDGNCYVPGTSIFVDLNTAASPNPSELP